MIVPSAELEVCGVRSLNNSVFIEIIQNRQRQILKGKAYMRLSCKGSPAKITVKEEQKQSWRIDWARIPTIRGDA
jgi:hypothetical protein